MQSKRFTMSIRVQANDIDHLGHVNNVIYLKFVQDVATAHWRSLTDADIQSQCLWVVLRHEIDYLNQAFEGDELLATTWVGDTHAARSDRWVEISNASNGKLLIKAKTTWCLIDPVTLKPKRVSPELIQLLTT